MPNIVLGFILGTWATSSVLLVAICIGYVLEEREQKKDYIARRESWIKGV